VFERTGIGKLLKTTWEEVVADCRCARNCFSCPRCESSLAVQASEKRAEDGSIESGAPYILACGGCRWTSREVGWEFEKPTGLAGESSSLIYGPD
jgi:hypothetical protein